MQLHSVCWKRSCTCSIEIWQLRARVDSSRGVLSNTLFVLAKRWLEIWSRVTFISRNSQVWYGWILDTQDPPSSLLLHGSVNCTNVRPTVVTCWLTLPFLVLNLVASQSPYSVRLHFSHASLCICTLKGHGTVFCEHSCMQFAFFFALLSCTCVCVYALTNNIKHDWLRLYLF